MVSLIEPSPRGAEIRADPIADAANDRHFDDHAKGRNACGPASQRARLALCIIPAMQGVASADGDFDRALL
jgi:hypothetical protein